MKATDRLGATYGDKIWRLTHLYKIRDKSKRLRVFGLNDIQKGILGFVQEQFVSKGEPIRAFFLKYRQGGVSTFWLLWWLDEAIFNPDTINGVLSHDRDSLKMLAGIVRTAFINIPDGLKPPLVIDNMDELAFGHGELKNGHYTHLSRMFVSLNIRSTPVHNLHISEHAHCSPDDIGASVGAVPPDGGITAETTANGMNHSYEVYHDGKIAVKTGLLQPGVLKSAFFPWFIQKEYRIAVPNGLTVRRTKEELGVIKRAKAEYGIDLDECQILYRRKLVKDTKGMRPQEFPENDEEAFLTSGNPFFNAQKVLVLLREAREAVKTMPVEETDDYTIWARPESKHVYAAGADVAGGREGDYSVLKIIDVTARKEVFRYRARVAPQRFYRVCDEWGRAYNNALLGVERNNHGHAILLGLDETCKYPNLFAEKESKRQRTRVITSTPKDTGKETVKLGWNTDINSRPLMLDQLRHAIEGEVDDDVEHFEPMWDVLDDVLLGEMLNFTEVDGKYEATTGKHDDTIFASAIAHQMFLKLARHAGTGGIEKVLTEPMASQGYYRAD